jgi:hypothetical protein
MLGNEIAAVKLEQGITPGLGEDGNAAIFLDEACHIPKALWRQSPVIPEPAIDGNGITVAKVFDDHVEHGSVVGFE